MSDKELNPYVEQNQDKRSLNPYFDPSVPAQTLNDGDIRNLLLAELSNFRSSLRSFWGGLGKSLIGNLWGFFLERGYGLMFRYTNLKTDTVKTNGLDYGSIFLEAANDAGANTPSWSFDIPKYTQKMLIKSTCSSLNYKTETAPFTAGALVTGGTSKATARIIEVFDEGTEGELVVAYVSGTFTNGETITDSSGGSAKLDKNNVGFINPVVYIYGVGGKEYGGTGVFKRWGAFDLWCPMRVMEWTVGTGSGTADPELIPGFSQEGFIYSRNTGGTRTLRIYQNGAWKSVNVSGGGGSISTVKKTHVNATGGAITYAHGLGSVPTKVFIKSNYGGSFSDGSWDGAVNSCIGWGGGNNLTNSYSVYLDQGGGDISYGEVTAVDATNITITWSVLGTPGGTADLLLQSWA